MERIGNEDLYRTVLRDVFRLRYEQVKTEEEISTGKKVNRPSDAAGFMATILESNRSLEQVKQYRFNLEAAGNWMKTSESSMNSILELLKKAKVLAEQGATGTLQSLEYEAIATQVSNLLAQIITLANTDMAGQYIFGGSRTDAPPITSTLQAHNPAELATDSGPGHGTVASVYQAGAGDFRFRITRDTTGSSATITISAGNTLGNSLGIIDFNTWDRNSFASDSPAAADMFTTTNGAASATTTISNQVGEELSWTGDSEEGEQTYRTSATLTVTGANTVNIGGTVFANTSAADLVDQVNNTAGLGYFAVQTGANTLQIVSRGTGAFSISEVGASGNLTIDADTNLNDVAEALNNGIQAQGVIHIDGGAAAFPPADSDTVTVGDNTWTWQEIKGGSTPATAAQYAAVLSTFLASHTDEFTATVSTSGTGATVQITARATGKQGNVTLASSNASVTTSGATYGGMAGTDTDTPGRLYGTGTASNLRLGTTIRGTVLEVDGDNVTVRLRWYDDDGTLHTQDAVLAGSGTDNKVEITGTGGLYLYRDSMDFNEGAVFTLEVGHYQGNEEDLAVNFSEGSQLDINWNAQQLLGGNLTINLLGTDANPGDNTGTGGLHLAGPYRGHLPRDLQFDVIDGGQVPGDDVTVRVRWTGDDNVAHSEDVTVSAGGLSNLVTVPGCDGVSFYLDGGTYVAGDTFHYRIEREPVHVLDTFTEWIYQMQNGTTEEAQTQSQVTLAHLTEAISNLTDQLGSVGTRQNRLTVRTQVLDDKDFGYSSTISELQEVDFTKAFLDLRALQTAYNAALRVISVTSNLYLVTQL